jgi:4-carboxymuconolactone decarboxylase
MEVNHRMRTNRVPWADRHNFQVMTDGERLIEPFNPLLYSPDGGTGFPDFQTAEERSSSLDDTIRWAVIRSVGAEWQSAYEIDAHSSIARQAGLSEDAIRTLQNGEPANDLTDKEQLARRYTVRLTSELAIDASVYQRAELAFGTQGPVDIALHQKVSDYLHASQRIRPSPVLTNPEHMWTPTHPSRRTILL